MRAGAIIRSKPLILASASPQRKKLLRRAGIAFRAVPSRVSENIREKNPRRLVLELAKRKARAVAKLHPERLVLGADTVVYCAGKVLVKPRSRRDSERILRLLNGRWQRVYTGVALALEGGKTVFTEAVLSRTLARRLSEDLLRGLFGKHMDKAGSYAVQDQDDPFIARTIGPRDNVIGLPVAAVRRLLRRARAFERRRA